MTNSSKTHSSKFSHNALEDERRYVAQELHDGVAQTTLQLGLQIGICRKLLEHNKLEMLADELAQLEDRIQIASTQLREMIADMRPPKVEPDAKLADYIQYTIDLHHERGGPPVRLEQTILPRLSSEQVLVLARIIQESLLNIRKHAEAKNVLIRLSEEDQRYRIAIEDDGQGFDLNKVGARSPDKGGAGFANIYARTLILGGALSIQTEDEGGGSKIIVTWPK